MKTIGLIGGMSWQSTVTYYRIINESVSKHMGGFHSAKILLYSVDFEEIEKCQAYGDWDKSADILADAAVILQSAGADFIVICTNTMHKIVHKIKEKINIPILHIAQTTAEDLIVNNITKTALIGTKYTMTQDFFKKKLREAGIEVLIPDENDIKYINHIIYDELCHGIMLTESKEKMLHIISKLSEQGAQGVILGCTEIGLIINKHDTSLPLFDTALIHATRSALYAMK